jgi:hypothetical protein
MVRRVRVGVVVVVRMGMWGGTMFMFVFVLKPRARGRIEMTMFSALCCAGGFDLKRSGITASTFCAHNFLFHFQLS